MTPASHQPEETLVFLDDDGSQVALDAVEALMLFGLTDGLDDVTVSACPTCRSRVLAAVAFADLLEREPFHPHAAELAELADDAPTLHLYVEDALSDCDHDDWLDPGYTEWVDTMDEVPGVRRPAP